MTKILMKRSEWLMHLFESGSKTYINWSFEPDISELVSFEEVLLSELWI